MLPQTMLKETNQNAMITTSKQNLNKVEYEARRHFWNKKREHPKDKIHELPTTGTKCYRIRINEFKRGYLP
jgi:hypothetical protein